MKKLLCTAALLTAFTLPAHAGGFDGPYLGLELGYNSTDGKLTASDPTIPATLSAQSSIAGAEGSAYAGYRRTEGHFVYGLEAGAELSSAKNDVLSVNDGAINDTENVKKRWGFSAGPRLGYLLNDSTLGFMGIDYARGYFRAGDNTGSGSTSRNGLRLGGGTEVALTDAVHLRLDWWHTWWQKWSETFGTETDSITAQENVVRVGVVFPF
ncbi:MAG: outer membrane beta-barrel protein [Candidatus Acidiferrum sp.]